MRIVVGGKLWKGGCRRTEVAGHLTKLFCKMFCETFRDTRIAISQNKRGRFASFAILLNGPF
jgi:hypothetical protein